ncbi:hypothetical protein NIES4102_32630 [Chondrocystis sp. NIES-4102]|nr:hypothetical protein NIES4102_32630 [Chondrocystis sp. NIES-4102]
MVEVKVKIIELSPDILMYLSATINNKLPKNTTARRIDYIFSFSLDYTQEFDSLSFAKTINQTEINRELRSL